jgi:hypothetical protein
MIKNVHLKWFLYHNSMAHAQVVAGGDSLQLRMAATKMLN